MQCMNTKINAMTILQKNLENSSKELKSGKKEADTFT